jgi:hypothetical protein
MRRTILSTIIAVTICALPVKTHADPGPPWIAPVPEPSTILAGGLLLVPLAVGAARAFRKPRR